jgi:acarbose 7IV-phosphotransferase
MPSKDVVVCGTLNLETSLPIGSFPLPYEPVHYRCFELSSHPSGVGFNVARALRELGNRVRFASMVGPDFLGTSLREALATFDLSNELVLPVLRETPQSVVLFDDAGRPMVHTDLKDVAETHYPVDRFERAVHACGFAVMTNAAFSRPRLSQVKAGGQASRRTCRPLPKAVVSTMPIFFGLPTSSS